MRNKYFCSDKEVKTLILIELSHPIQLDIEQFFQLTLFTDNYSFPHVQICFALSII